MPEEFKAIRREQLFVQGQVACDSALLAVMPVLEQRINTLIPDVTAKQLKEKLALCQTKEEKAACMRAKMLTVLLRTATEIYSLASLTVSLKVCYVVAAVRMLQDEDTEAGQAAEGAVNRIVSKLLEDGLEKMVVVLREAIEESLEGWSIQRPCTESDFGDLWANIRQKVEGRDDDDNGSLVRGDEIQRSLLRYCFPFGSGENLFMQTVESALFSDGTLAVCEAVNGALFSVYLEHAPPRAEATTTPGDGGGGENKALPLLRVVSQTQGDASKVLCANPAQNPYLAPMVSNELLMDFLKLLSSLHVPGAAVKRVLFVSEVDVIPAMAVGLCKQLGGITVEAFSLSIRTGEANTASGITVDAARDAMTELGIELGENVAAGSLASVKGIHFDAIIVLDAGISGAVPLLCKQRLEWSIPKENAVKCRLALEEKIRALLITLNGGD